VLLGEIEGDDPARDPDLDRRQTDARCRIHGLEHVGDEAADALVDLADRLGYEPQAGVPQLGDLARGPGWRGMGTAGHGRLDAHRRRRRLDLVHDVLSSFASIRESARRAQWSRPFSLSATSP